MMQLPFEPYSGKEPYVFMSYSHEDKELAYPELQRLHGLGYRIWYDKRIALGTEWRKEIADAIEGCAVFLVFLSPDAVKSKWVQREIHHADGHGKPTIAVYLLETKLPSDWAIVLSGLQAGFLYGEQAEECRKKMELALSPARALEEPGESAKSGKAQDQAVLPVQQPTVPPGRHVQRPVAEIVEVGPAAAQGSEKRLDPAPSENLPDQEIQSTQSSPVPAHIHVEQPDARPEQRSARLERTWALETPAARSGLLQLAKQGALVILGAVLAFLSFIAIDLFLFHLGIAARPSGGYPIFFPVLLFLSTAACGAVFFEVSRKIRQGYPERARRAWELAGHGWLWVWLWLGVMAGSTILGGGLLDEHSLSWFIWISLAGCASFALWGLVRRAEMRVQAGNSQPVSPDGSPTQ